MRVFVTIAILLLAGCRPPCDSNRYIAGWCVEGNVTPAYAAEIEAVANITNKHGEKLTVYDAPYSCGSISPSGLCDGSVGTLGDVAVVYNPELGLGPSVGSTALEHEFCHLVVGYDEAATECCVNDIVPAVSRAVEP